MLPAAADGRSLTTSSARHTPLGATNSARAGAVSALCGTVSSPAAGYSLPATRATNCATALAWFPNRMFAGIVPYPRHVWLD